MTIFTKFPTAHTVEGPHPQNCSQHWMVEKARIFMIAAHEAVGQRRKYSNELYGIHPMEVAAHRAMRPNATVEDIVAAILHDVVEDTGITLELIAAEFGITVAELVDALTDIAVSEDGIRVIRMAINNRHTRGTSDRAKAIKLCDVDHNVKNIVAGDPGFARKYIPEKKTLLIDADMRNADPELYDSIMKFCDDYIEKKNLKWAPTTPEVIAAVDEYFAKRS